MCFSTFPLTFNEIFHLAPQSFFGSLYLFFTLSVIYIQMYLVILDISLSMCENISNKTLVQSKRLLAGTNRESVTFNMLVLDCEIDGKINGG